MGKRVLYQFPIPPKLSKKKEAAFEIKSLLSRLKWVYCLGRVAITSCSIAGSFNKCFLNLLGIKSVIKESTDLFPSEACLGL